MKQIEIDSHIGNWFTKREMLREAKANLSRAESYFNAATEQCAKALLPSDATKDQRYIYPTTDGRGIVAYLKPVQQFSVPDGEVSERLELACEEHKFK